MIYSSITPYVHMLRTAEDDEEHVCLDFSDPNPRRGREYGHDSFGVGQPLSLAIIADYVSDLEYQVLVRWERGCSWRWEWTDHGLRYRGRETIFGCIWP
jgi:hypothetical protein